jgi:hypothetical protein
MRKLPSPLAIAMGLIMLGSCGKPPPLTKAENERVDRAMAKVEAEQDRTDRAEILKQSKAAAELPQGRSTQPQTVMEIPAQPIQSNTSRQHFPQDIRPQILPDRAFVASSRSAN